MIVYMYCSYTTGDIVFTVHFEFYHCLPVVDPTPQRSDKNRFHLLTVYHIVFTLNSALALC